MVNDCKTFFLFTRSGCVIPFQQVELSRGYFWKIHSDSLACVKLLRKNTLTGIPMLCIPSFLLHQLSKDLQNYLHSAKKAWWSLTICKKNGQFLERLCPSLIYFPRIGIPYLCHVTTNNRLDWSSDSRISLSHCTYRVGLSCVMVLKKNKHTVVILMA